MMRSDLLQPDMDNRGLVLDPRTKMLLLMTMAVFVIGGAGGRMNDYLMPFLCAMPFILFLTAKKWKKTCGYFIVCFAAYFCFLYFGPRTAGIVNFILLAVCGILSRFLPGIMMGTYLIETTTVSEFNAAMGKMHVSEKITIPLSVMFRFFPTVIDEFASINAAMRMREIRIGGRNAGKMIEYRLVPLMVCSAKIGEELNAAALTRGLGGDVKRTNTCKIGLHIQDVILIVICMVPYTICLVQIIGRVRG